MSHRALSYRTQDTGTCRALSLQPERRRAHRPRVAGKFLYLGDEKLWVRGVTYGTFRPEGVGREFHDTVTVERDFAQMSANGLNAVRTYTVPPRWVLDAAGRHGLRVLVGLPWEHHITFLEDKGGARDIEARMRAGVKACVGHPAILGYAIGNEIPAPIVRWHGPRAVKRYVRRLYEIAKAEDPDGLVTYVNYPTTEYLDLPFLDFVCFNVYLESQARLEAYLARLHNLAGAQPLVMTEIGLDSRRNGEKVQAQALEWQVRTAFEAGCAGAFVFAWTDEWYRGGYDIDDWDFGLTTRDRRPKPALAAVREAFTEVPFPNGRHWPRVSVVVCTYNGERTIRDCFDGLVSLEYPNFEVIVVNDGSNDHTAAIAREYGFRQISTENRGLGNARNTGLHAATGEIVAYIDDDAYPDPHWLAYLAATFMSSTHVGVGGPNIPPAGDGSIAECVANAPGGPIHVLLSDREAEHIPGCNMAFRKRALDAIGGFDPEFRTAGDDVDVCWRLQQREWTLGFSAGAVVWHHRRNSVRAYWRQQTGYGRAEALLERKWPEKYNAAGHVMWAGRLYGKGLTRTLGLRRGRIYHGRWGSALFQSLYEPAASTGCCALPLMPEWYLVITALVLLSALGLLWSPLLLAVPLLAIAIGAPLAQAALSVARASFAGRRSRAQILRMRWLTACLHLIQPLARLWGRATSGLTPWRWRGSRAFALPPVWTRSFWRERWRAPEETLQSLEAALRAEGVSVLRGGDYDRWDLEVRVGLLGATRLLMVVEEHGAGRQLVRFRWWPRCSPGGFAVIVAFAALSTGAALDRVWIVSAMLGLAAVVPALRVAQECGRAAVALLRSLEHAVTETT